MSQPRWVPLTAAAGVLIVLGTSWALWSRNENAARQAALAHQFRAAPSFSLKDAQGQVHKLSDLKGSLVILHFWASWCPPCLEELPQWLELAKSYEGKPIKWVAISLDPNWEDAHRFLPEKEIPKNGISVIDPETKLPEVYGTYQFPETYIISRDQKVISKWVGPQEWNGPRVHELIEQVLKVGDSTGL